MLPGYGSAVFMQSRMCFGCKGLGFNSGFSRASALRVCRSCTQHRVTEMHWQLCSSGRKAAGKTISTGLSAGHCAHKSYILKVNPKESKPYPVDRFRVFSGPGKDWHV